MFLSASPLRAWLVRARTLYAERDPPDRSSLHFAHLPDFVLINLKTYGCERDVERGFLTSAASRLEEDSPCPVEDAEQVNRSSAVFSALYFMPDIRTDSRKMINTWSSEFIVTLWYFVLCSLTVKSDIPAQILQFLVRKS